MVPSFFVQLDGIPLSANGKLDRSLLPAPDGGSVGQQVYSAPQDGIERTVAEIWQEILGVEKIGRNDDFFDLGGHSLLVHQMMARVFDSCRVKVSFAALFENPRLYMFARIVKERQMTEFFSEADEVKTALAQLSKDELLAMLKEDSSNV
jgi:hypothetical protein